MNNREALLKRLQICDFNLFETALFLDTHPDDQEALAYYNKYLVMQQQTLEEYTSRFGPIMHGHASSNNKWTWVDDPWPWENREV